MAAMQYILKAHRKGNCALEVAMQKADKIAMSVQNRAAELGNPPPPTPLESNSKGSAGSPGRPERSNYLSKERRRGKLGGACDRRQAGRKAKLLAVSSFTIFVITSHAICHEVIESFVERGF